MKFRKHQTGITGRNIVSILAVIGLVVLIGAMIRISSMSNPTWQKAGGQRYSVPIARCDGRSFKKHAKNCSKWILIKSRLLGEEGTRVYVATDRIVDSRHPGYRAIFTGEDGLTGYNATPSNLGNVLEIEGAVDCEDEMDAELPVTVYVCN